MTRPIPHSNGGPSDTLRGRPVRPVATASFAVGAALTATIAVTTLNDGGFNAASQSMFVVLAGVTLLAASTLDSRTVSAAARSPLALTLVGLAAMSVASAAWTVDGRATALRAGLVVGGYAAVFVAAATLARRTGPWPFAAAIAALALIEAVLGLHAVAMHSLPDAERIDGLWRPGGSFQYPPALALLQVAALPALCGLLDGRPRLLAGGAGAAALLAGAVLGLSQSRPAIAMAVVLLGVLAARPRTRERSRMAAVGTATLVALGTLLAPVLLHAKTGAAGHGTGTAGLAGIAALAVAAAGVCVVARSLPVARVRSRWTTGAALLACAAVALAAWPGNTHTHTSPRRPTARPHRYTTPRRSDWLHGRGHEWDAALQTWLDRPLLGAGAGAYYTASLSHQGSAPTQYAHDLPLELAAELGVLGLLFGLALYASAAQIISRAASAPGLWLLAPTVIAFLASNLLDWTWRLAGLSALWAAAAGALHGCTSDSSSA
jgi:O-antigen ligase